MFKKFLINLPIILMILIIIICCKETSNTETEWINLHNLGPNINSAAKDEHATFPADGKVMYFASDREGGAGNYDIYRSKYIDGEWSKAELVPPPINTPRDDYDPFLTLDGKKLFFASNRDNNDKYWNCDIYMSEWDGFNWSEPRKFDPIFCTPGKPDWGAGFTKDMTLMIFSSGRGEGEKSPVQIFQSRLIDGKWSEPLLLPEPVNSGIWEATPFITPDGKYLYLNSARGEKDKKDVDIWRFEQVDGKWTNATFMKGPFLSNKHDYDPCLSPDGTKFYFTSDREGGLGGPDIYVVERKMD